MTLRKLLDLPAARKALAIDKFNLDEDLVRVPELIYHVSESAVLAASDYDKAKRELDELRAELHTKVRKGLEKASEGRVTDVMVTNGVELCDDYRNKREEVLELKREAELWEAMREAHRTRGYKLGELAQYMAITVRDSIASPRRDDAVARVAERVERKSTRR